MIDRLEQLLGEMSALQSKLLLLVGLPRTGKSAALHAIGQRVGAQPLDVGASLGRKLAALPQRRRHLEAGNVLRELGDQHAHAELLLIDNIEILFDQALMVRPLELLKRLAQARRIIAVWPGEARGGRLTYAEMGHPEYQDYAADGVVTFEIK